MEAEGAYLHRNRTRRTAGRTAAALGGQGPGRRAPWAAAAPPRAGLPGGGSTAPSAQRLAAHHFAQTCFSEVGAAGWLLGPLKVDRGSGGRSPPGLGLSPGQSLSPVGKRLPAAGALARVESGGGRGGLLSAPPREALFLCPKAEGRPPGGRGS